MQKAQEEFQSFSPPFEKYRISNFGRVFSGEKEMKPYLQKNGKYLSAVQILSRMEDGKRERKIVHIANEVYKRFGIGWREGCHVFHVDGDIKNNQIDNLRICRGYTDVPNDLQAGRADEIIPCVKHAIRTLGFKGYEKYGFDIGNAIGNAALMCWEHLAQFKPNTSFYAYCKRYARWAVLWEWKHWKKYGGILSLETLEDDMNSCACHE